MSALEMADIFTHSFRATELDARNGMDTIIARLIKTGADEDWAGNVQIALAEAINNIVEHAYANLPIGDVEVSYELDQTGLTLRITDSGRALAKEEMPPGDPVDLNVSFEDLPEGGFGWFLLRTLTRSIGYDRKNGNNILTLKFDTAAT